MSDEGSTLRNKAAGLRFKAQTGALASAAVRDLAIRVPLGMQARVDASVGDGSFAMRLATAIKKAREALPDASEAEQLQGAVLELMAWSQSLAVDVVATYYGEVEAHRTRLAEEATDIETRLAG